MNTAGEPFPLVRAANGEMEMNAQATKLQAAENDLKQLMADVTQAMEKAQEAVARIASKAAAATTETDCRVLSHCTRDGRIPLGGGPIRYTTDAHRRLGSSSSCGHRHTGFPTCRPRSKGCDLGNSDRLRRRRRPRQVGPSRLTRGSCSTFHNVPFRKVRLPARKTASA
jgi:hypothetical protein